MQGDQGRCREIKGDPDGWEEDLQALHTARGTGEADEEEDERRRAAYDLQKRRRSDTTVSSCLDRYVHAVSLHLVSTRGATQQLVDRGQSLEPLEKPRVLDLLDLP